MTSTTPEKTDVLGIDVGLTLVNPTSGLCRTGCGGDVVSHTFIDYGSRTAIVGTGSFAVIAIDAPVLPVETLHYDVRPCEKVFVWGPFQKRCKPGESHVPGTGQALRRSGVETARTFAPHVASASVVADFPKIYGDRNIVEAFPNGFLGVSLEAGSFQNALGQGERFDWLYGEWLSQGVHSRLSAEVQWLRKPFWGLVAANSQHDERAALICAITAACVLLGRYVAVGEALGGYFFMPPWNVWQSWAKDALRRNRHDPRLPRSVEVWINGTCFKADRDLPA